MRLGYRANGKGRTLDARPSSSNNSEQSHAIGSEPRLLFNRVALVSAGGAQHSRSGALLGNARFKAVTPAFGNFSRPK